MPDTEQPSCLALGRWRHYSGGMISEFHQLSEKVARLAEMAHDLRRENAQLRMEMAALRTENTDLNQRVQEAALRVSALLDKLPLPEHENQEAA